MPSSSLKNTGRNIFLFGIFLLVASLPYSKFMMSLAQIILILGWLLEGGLKEKLMAFWRNRTALVLSSLFLAHVAGLLYTTDFKYGLEDVKAKIPLMLLPLLLSTSAPLTPKLFGRLLMLFSLAVSVATFICFAALLGFSKKEVLHPQQASLFISHIRFGLLISMNVFVLGWFIKNKPSLSVRLGLMVLIIWHISFLIMMESAGGLVCTAAVLAFLLIRRLFTSGNMVAKISTAGLLIAGTTQAWLLYSSAAESLTPDPKYLSATLPATTKQGNAYTHDTNNTEIENRNYVWRNVCEPELQEAWEKRSSIPYAGKDLRGNDIKYTMTRYLTSKGLAKDAEGVNVLSSDDLRAIEKGIPNMNFNSLFNPGARLQKILWEINIYKKGGNPSGHSVAQRLEFWKASTAIIRDNLLFGTGTGDVKNAFINEYERSNSPLTKEWRLRSHNQYLAIGTALGLFGVALFIFTLLYPLFAEKNARTMLYAAFFIIAIVSMLSEDTLENQAGITFFAFFNSILLFLQPKSTSTTS